MKTNQIMVRPMGDFEIIQRTCDGKFDCTNLLAQWNKTNKNNIKKIGDYLRLKETREFVKALMEEPEFKDGNSHLLESDDYKDFPKSIVVVTRGKNGGTYMTPLMFLDFAMWLNPAFKVKVLKFVQDEMIRYRNDAGDAYKELSSAIMKIVPKDFMPKAMQKIGEALNWVVFNQHEKMLRNKFGDEKKQRELWQLEKKVADLINEGFITSFDNLISYLRNQYQKRNYPPVFLAS
jgi:hypothetical protein